MASLALACTKRSDSFGQERPVLIKDSGHRPAAGTARAKVANARVSAVTLLFRLVWITVPG
jgi:hypothetical protein